MHCRKWQATQGEDQEADGELHGMDTQWGDEPLSQEDRMQAAFHKLLRRQLLVRALQKSGLAMCLCGALIWPPHLPLTLPLPVHLVRGPSTHDQGWMCL